MVTRQEEDSMFDPKQLLDALVGSVAVGGSPGRTPAAAAAPAPQDQAEAGGLGGLLGQFIGSMTQGGGAAGSKGLLPSGIEDAVGRLTGGRSTGDLLGTAQDYLRTPQGNTAISAVAGGLAGLLLGTKTGRNVAGSAASLGGLALIGGLAYKAFQNWQGGHDTATTQQAPALPPPSDTPFGKEAATHDSALRLVRAMIAAAAADGHVDDAERARIVGGLHQAGFDADAASFLDREFAAPATPEALAAGVKTPEAAAQVYTAARLAIEPDTPEERAFLIDLATRLSLDSQLVAHIDAAAAGAKG
jgi:uncharacterized membrane protein YebE (DUF533 family)